MSSATDISPTLGHVVRCVSGDGADCVILDEGPKVSLRVEFSRWKIVCKNHEYLL